MAELPIPVPENFPQGFVLRIAQAEDSAAVRDVFASVHEEYGFSAEFDERDADLNDVSQTYTHPQEFFAVVLRESDNQVVGCIALSRYSDEAAELVRFYLYPEARGFGLGIALTLWTLDVARAWGYQKVLLETHTVMMEAMGLYKKLGFVEIPPYCGLPEDYSNVGFEFDLTRTPATVSS